MSVGYYDRVASVRTHQQKDGVERLAVGAGNAPTTVGVVLKDESWEEGGGVVPQLSFRMSTVVRAFAAWCRLYAKKRQKKKKKERCERLGQLGTSREEAAFLRALGGSIGTVIRNVLQK